MAGRRARTCKTTGLRLVPSAATVINRVTKYSWGALNPPIRLPGSVVLRWGRYDVLGHRTAYGADPVGLAYAETLAYLSPSVGVQNTRLSDVFDDVDATNPTTLLDVIKREWRQLWQIEPHKIVAGWREARNVYHLTLPSEGWFVDIEHKDSLAALNRNLSSTLAQMAIPRLTRAHLCGEDRPLTTEVAGWVRAQTLDDGSRPHGIMYSSKHGTGGRCYAIWLRMVDDGQPVDAEPTKADAGAEIQPPVRNPELAAVANDFGLIIM